MSLLSGHGSGSRQSGNTTPTRITTMDANLPLLAFLMNKTPMELFKVGGPVMWPMFMLSLVAATVAIERLIFAWREKRSRSPKDLREFMKLVHKNNIADAIRVGQESTDLVPRILAEALEHKEGSMADAFMRSSSQELARYQQGLPVLDTAITAAPLLGLLGTVTGMMNSFGQISGELGAPTAITGGVAEALVATACGLFVAVSALFPFNYVNSMLENARREIEESGNTLELTLWELGHHVNLTGAIQEAPPPKGTPAQALEH
jgi:biopolymer transport protein ExbB